MADWNTNLIAELRANHGEVAAGPMAGRNLLVLTSTGARSGEPRESVLTYSRDGDKYVVCATAGGAPVAPGWFHNLVANPVARVEAKGKAFQIRATVTDEPEQTRLWDAHVAERPEFAGYPEQSGRVIPVITLEPIAS
ncbi:MAG TPA: nitroreductase/quinone reductase family protein [Candidatus Limnocylindrales bacterium]|nr:nitroreductase/quinone reductase family protein [Candidatus Limnocylindrales bacterium]